MFRTITATISAFLASTPAWIWQQTRTFIIEPPFHLLDDPIVPSRGWNLILNGILCICILMAIQNVIGILFYAGNRFFHKADAEQRRRRASFFLTVAILALPLPLWLRHEHRMAKAALQKAILAWRDHQLNIGQPGVIKHYFNDNLFLKPERFEWTGGQLPKPILQEFPWAPDDWTRLSSMWSGSFTWLIANPQANWWSQQWGMGYLAWGIWLSHEGISRAVPLGTVLSFLLLGSCVNLSATQCISYALVMLWPKPTVDAEGRALESWSLNPKLVVFLSGLQALILCGLPGVLNSGSSLGEKHNAWDSLFHLLHIGYLVMPVLVALLVYLCRGKITIDLSANQPVGTSLRTAWYVVFGISTALHWYSSYQAHVDSNGGSYLFGTHNKWGGQLSSLIPWRNEPSPAMRYSEPFSIWKPWRSHWSNVLLVFGQVPWVNALAWDVLFSVIGLCLWAVYGKMDFGPDPPEDAPNPPDGPEQPRNPAPQGRREPKKRVKSMSGRDVDLSERDQAYYDMPEVYGATPYEGFPNNWNTRSENDKTVWWEQKLQAEMIRRRENGLPELPHHQVVSDAMGFPPAPRVTRAKAKEQRMLRLDEKIDKTRTRRGTKWHMCSILCEICCAPDLLGETEEVQEQAAPERPAHDPSPVHEEPEQEGGLSLDDSTEAEKAAAEDAGLTFCLWILGGLGAASASVFNAD